MMRNEKEKINRRDFFKTVGSVGLGSAIAAGAFADANAPNTLGAPVEPKKTTEFPPLPKRKLGKTGFEVPVLCNGLMFDVTERKAILRANLKYNVTYWDTAHSYGGGNSEIAIGQFLKRNPEVRKDLFIVTKASGARRPEDVQHRLQQSLQRMNTNYIDLYFGVHGCGDPNSQLTDELRKQAENAKKRGLIRAFGFSTHHNMERCLMAAAKLDWIDAIMTSYNVALMHRSEMQEAIQACHEAGVGLVAMKVLLGLQNKKPEAEYDIMTHFLDKGYSREQALIKAVLSDEKITAACVRMENVALLKSNVAAVLDKTELTRRDRQVLKTYAAQSCSGYCAGCADICAQACPDMPYVSEVMRYLMYYKSYGDTDTARELFAQLPSSAKRRLLTADYSVARARCPQHMPIAELMAEASQKLA